MPSLRFRAAAAADAFDGHGRRGQKEAVKPLLKNKEGHGGGKAQSGTLRAAVFGVNDGLVSNLSLVMGIAGATQDSAFVLLAGIAGLLAGAFSMGAGEFISMKVQREVFENQINIERNELAGLPEEERAELQLIYEKKGLSRENAAKISEALMENEDLALETHVREELGLNPGELGSPVGAAFSSFWAFVAGAIIPVVPYAITSGKPAFVSSIISSALGLLAVGGALSILTRKNWLLSSLRMLAIGAAAATITYFVGSLFGVTVNA